MVPFWVPSIIRHLLFRVPQKGTLILTTTHVGSGSFSDFGLETIKMSRAGLLVLAFRV